MTKLLKVKFVIYQKCTLGYDLFSRSWIARNQAYINRCIGNLLAFKRNKLSLQFSLENKISIIRNYRSNDLANGDIEFR